MREGRVPGREAPLPRPPCRREGPPTGPLLSGPPMWDGATCWGLRAARDYSCCDMGEHGSLGPLSRLHQPREEGPVPPGVSSLSQACLRADPGSLHLHPCRSGLMGQRRADATGHGPAQTSGRTGALPQPPCAQPRSNFEELD